MSSVTVSRIWMPCLLVGLLVGCGTGVPVELPSPTGSDYESGTVTAVLLEDGRFGGLVTLMEVAKVFQGPPGAEDLLGTAAEVATRTDWSHTLFAPTDDAFSHLDQEVIDCMFDEANATRSIRTHLVDIPLHSSDFRTENVQTMGGLFPIEVTDGGLTFAGAEVIETDIDASNGVIHAVARVNVPDVCVTDSG